MSRFPRYTSVIPIKHCARKLLFSNDRQITNDILNTAGASTTKNTTQRKCESLIRVHYYCVHVVLPNTKDACDCIHNTTVFVTRTVLECSLMRWLVEKEASSWSTPNDSNQPWPSLDSRISRLIIGSCLLLRMSFNARKAVWEKNKGCWYNETWNPCIVWKNM